MSHRQKQNLKTFSPMPGQVLLPDVNNSSLFNGNRHQTSTLSNSTVISTPDPVSVVPAATMSSFPDSSRLPVEFLEKLERMDYLRQQQREALLNASAVSNQMHPQSMIDRGVLDSELPSDEKQSLDDIPFDPKSIRVTLTQGGFLRSVAIVSLTPVFCPFSEKNYIEVPKTAMGFSKGHIQKILSKMCSRRHSRKTKSVQFFG
jgi:hypothetical protein